MSSMRSLRVCSRRSAALMPMPMPMPMLLMPFLFCLCLCMCMCFGLCLLALFPLAAILPNHTHQHAIIVFISSLISSLIF